MEKATDPGGVRRRSEKTTDEPVIPSVAVTFDTERQKLKRENTGLPGYIASADSISEPVYSPHSAVKSRKEGGRG